MTRSNWYRRFYHRVIAIRGEPRAIAAGLALGVFIGMSPFYGLHAIVGITLAAIVRWNKIAATAGVMITNPLTAPILYPATYAVGRLITGSAMPDLPTDISMNAVMVLVRQSPRMLLDLSVGGVVIGFPLAAITYGLSLRAIRRYRQSRNSS